MGKYLAMTEHKNNFTNSILNDEDLVRALNYSEPYFLDDAQCPVLVSPSNLAHVNIFPYKHVPDIQEEAKTFITMSIRYEWVVERKRTFRKLIFTVFGFTHQNLQKTDYGFVRTDYIADKIEELMNEKKCFGVNRMFMSEYDEYQIAESEYNGFYMKYESLNLTEQKFYDNR